MSVKRRWRARTIAPVAGLLASFLVFPLLRLPLFLGIEQKTVDARMRLRGQAEVAPEVVVCAIDAKSIDRLGQWPWPRTVLADLVVRLRSAGARAIALDIVFSEPSRLGVEQDEALAAVLAQRDDVVLGFYLSTQAGARGIGRPGETVLPAPVEIAVTPPAGFPELPSYPHLEANIPILSRAAPYAGHFVVQPDRDGTVRHYPLVLEHGGTLYPSLALRAVQVFLGAPPISVRPRQGRIPVIRIGELEVPASERGELWVNFRGSFGATFRYLSAVDVIDGLVPAGTFSDKLVFVGATETGIGDLRTSPFDTVVPGVEIHATVADNLLHRRFIRDGGPEAILGILAVLIIGPLCAWTAGFFRRPLTGAAAALGGLVLFGVAAQGAFSFGERHILVVVPLLAGTLGYTFTALWRTVYAEANARRIRRVFRHFLSEPVMVEMLRDTDRLRLGGERRDLTVLFSDIRGFTTLAEGLSPERVVVLLNAYLTPMTEIILREGGTLDKYMGDAVMAFFGAPVSQPDHAVRACTAALAMQERVGVLNREWSGNGLPPIANGVGINTGPMAVGNMGSTMIFDYTVVGDHVNLGSRVEGLTKFYGIGVAVTEYTEKAARDRFRFRELDRVRVKGKREPIRIYELIGPAGPDQDRFLETFSTALAVWRRREFEKAGELFRRAARIRPEDRPTAIYLDRLASFRDAPPPGDWDGVTNLQEK